MNKRGPNNFKCIKKSQKEQMILKNINKKKKIFLINSKIKFLLNKKEIQIIIQQVNNLRAI
jgi:hypothetical protein